MSKVLVSGTSFGMLNRLPSEWDVALRSTQPTYHNDPLNSVAMKRPMKPGT